MVELNQSMSIITFKLNGPENRYCQNKWKCNSQLFIDYNRCILSVNRLTG
jgi:hypothetical protein